MYRAIIVDDEESVRGGLQRHVDWKKHDIEVAALFANGRDALEYIKSAAVDLIITDVCMPYMDGIALSKAARALYPEVKILFISGYADVHYLRDALNVEAVDYIFKSIDLDEMDAALTRVAGKIDSEQKRNRHYLALEEQLEQSLPLIRNSRLRALLHDDAGESDLTAEDAAREMRFLGLPLDQRMHYAVMVMRLLNKWQDMRGVTYRDGEIFGLRVTNLCEETLAQYGSSICFRDRPSDFILIVNAESEDCENAFLEIAQLLHARMRDTFQAEVVIGISNRFSGLDHMGKAYRDACDAIRKRYLIEEGAPISVNKFEGDSGGKNLRARVRRDIEDAMAAGDAEGARAALEGALAAMRQMERAEDQQNFLLYLLLLPTDLLGDVEAGQRGAYASQRALLERYLLCRTPDEQILLISQLYGEATELLALRSAPKPFAVVRRVKEIIEQKYMERLSVSALAGAVYLSPTYLCVLFKQQTGQTLNDAITWERIRRAKALLADPNILLYDVGYKVGYLSPSYFSRLFKKCTGKTPTEYREAVCPPREMA